jgi:(p)ppGpp synthase/HD superfamily hydrolase
MAGTPDLEHAIRLAVTADYKNPVDKAGRPYVLHVLRVMHRLTTDDEMIVGVLHDLIEDTPYTLDDLRRMGYPKHILDALDSVTRREGETYEQFVDRAAANPIGRRVKLADLEDNMDIRRLSEVSDRDVTRLRKYLRAWRRLTHGAA